MMVQKLKHKFQNWVFHPYRVNETNYQLHLNSFNNEGVVGHLLCWCSGDEWNWGQRSVVYDASAMPTLIITFIIITTNNSLKSINDIEKVDKWIHYYVFLFLCRMRDTLPTSVLWYFFFTFIKM